MRRGKNEQGAIDEAQVKLERMIAFKRFAEAKSRRLLSDNGDPALALENVTAFWQSASVQPMETSCFSGHHGAVTDHALTFRRLDYNTTPSLKSVNTDSDAHLMHDGSGDGILIVYDYIRREDCEALIQHAGLQSGKALEITVFHDREKREIEGIKDAVRIGDSLSIEKKKKEILNIFHDIYCHWLVPFYSVDFDWYETPQMLCYPVGGKYDLHADADVWVEEKKVHVRMLDRDYSVLLYLNDAYEGGEIRFERQNYMIKPTAGMLVAFPSDYRYAHTALPVKSGLKYTLVSWAAIAGSKRVLPGMPADAISLKTP